MDKAKLIDLFVDNEIQKELAITAISMLRNEEDARDLLQDVAVSLALNDKLPDVDVPIAFFKTCLRNAAINKIKKEKRSTPLESTNIDNLSNNYKLDAGYERIEWMDWLKKSIATYPEDKREAFIMYYLDGYPIETIAKKFGTTPNALAQQFKRMREKIKKHHPYLFMLLFE